MITYRIVSGDMDEKVKAESYEEAFAKALDAAERKGKAKNLGLLFEIIVKGEPTRYADTSKQLKQMGRME